MLVHDVGSNFILRGCRRRIFGDQVVVWVRWLGQEPLTGTVHLRELLGVLDELLAIVIVADDVTEMSTCWLRSVLGSFKVSRWLSRTC